MAQNELRLRALKNNKILGEIIYCTLQRAKELKLNLHWDAKPRKAELVVFWQRKGNVWWGCEPMSRPQADSLELRSPFKDKNDKWLWEGDKIKYIGKGYVGEILFYEGAFCIDWQLEDEEDINLFYHKVGYFDLLKEVYYDTTSRIEKIGTIHEGEDNHGTD